MPREQAYNAPAAGLQPQTSPPAHNLFLRPLPGICHAATGASLPVFFLFVIFFNLIILPTDAATSCPVASDAPSGTVTITGCTVDTATYTIDVGSLVSALYDGGARPSAFVVTIGDIVAQSSSPVVLYVTNTSAFTFTTIPVNISLQSFTSSPTTPSGSLVFDVVLPTVTSTVDVGRVEVISSASLLQLSCGYAALCVSTSTVSSVQLFLIRNITSTVVQLSGASVAAGTTWASVRFVPPVAATSWALSNTKLEIAILSVNVSINTVNANVHVVDFPAVPLVLSHNSVVALNTNCTGSGASACAAVSVRNAQNSSDVVGLSLTTVTVTSGTLRVTGMSMSLPHVTDGGAVTYINGVTHVVHANAMTLTSSAATVTVSGVTFLDDPQGPSTLVASSLVLFFASTISLNGSSTLLLQSCRMNTTSAHRVDAVTLASLNNVSFDSAAVERL